MDVYRNSKAIHSWWKSPVELCRNGKQLQIWSENHCYTSCDGGLHWEQVAGKRFDEFQVIQLGPCTISAPFCKRTPDFRLAPAPSLKRNRVWTRRWQYKPLNPTWQIELPFYYQTAKWPEIELISVEAKDFCLDTGCYELDFTVDVGTAQQLDFFVFGECFLWNAFSNQLVVGDQTLYLHQEDGLIQFHLVLDPWFCVLSGTSNIIGFPRTSDPSFYIGISAQCGTAGSFKGENQGILVDLKVFGLRPLEYNPDFCQDLSKYENQEPVYESGSFQICPNRLSDIAFGKPDAWVLDKYTILSAQRVTEEFQWRHTPMGDMTRCLNRSDLIQLKPKRDFPDIHTGIPSVDAAYQIALDVLDTARSERHALQGEAGLWSAGAFQGQNLGFGVWVRDSMQIIAKGGAFWDPETSRKTLLHIVQEGHDNAIDGIPAPIICSWDYYLATHDLETIKRIWPNLEMRLSKADAYYDPVCQLYFADKNSANDAFADTDSGGYALSTEIYFMAAFDAAANLALLIDPDKRKRYEKKAKALRKEIQKRYWNSKHGIFTAGPVGSCAYENGYWETCGQEAAIWSRFGIADDSQRDQILNVLERTIMTDFGIPLMPWREEKSHLTHAAWPVYYAGFAEAAGESGRAHLLMQLIAQLIRSAVFNKTFYEVLETDSGRCWRWPAQTWHAMGYVAVLLFGVFGVRYDGDCMIFRPSIPSELKGISLTNLPYCNMVLSIKTTGTGRIKSIYLDGRTVEKVPYTLTGIHEVLLACEEL